MAVAPKSGVKKPAAITGAIAFAALVGCAGWFLMERTGEMPDTAQSGASADASSEIRPMSRRQARVDEIMSGIQEEAAAAEARRQQTEKRGYYTIHDADLMLARAGQLAAVRGPLERVRFSASGLTMYLEFSEETPVDEPRAYAMARDIVDGIREQDLLPLVGKHIEIRGVIDIETVPGTRRPRIHLLDRDQITVLDDGASEYELQ